MGGEPLTKYGRNLDVDSGSVPEDVWSGGGIWVPPTAARVHTLTGSANNVVVSGRFTGKVLPTRWTPRAA